MPNQIKIIVVEDHKLFRQTLIPFLKEFNIVTIAEAENGFELLELLKTKKPDVILLDYEMPLMNGMEALKRIKELYPRMKVIFLTMYCGDHLMKHLHSLGINSFLTKNTDIHDVVKEIRLVHATKTVSKNSSPSQNNLKNKFSKRETQISPLVCQGRSNVEIAETLGISEKTVEGHKNNLFRKTNTKNAGEFVNYITKNELQYLK